MPKRYSSGSSIQTCSTIQAGRRKRPYDVTAHTLPLLFGVDVAHVMGAAPATGAPIKEIAEPTYTSVLSGKSTKRIALFRPSASEPIDAGWTHWILDVYKVPFTTITEKDLATGGAPNDRFDAIIFPDGTLGGGGRGGRGGRGAAGGGGGDVFASLDAFANNGGSILAFNSSSSAMIEGLKLPVKNVLAWRWQQRLFTRRDPFSRSRSNARARSRAGSRRPCLQSGSRMGRHSRSLIHQIATAVASYPASGNPLLSGWLLGGSKLNGKAALVDVKHGRGHVVLYGFRPQYRGSRWPRIRLSGSAIQ
jgi:hypothetical protein